MMYVEKESEIREWILYGRPERLRDRNDHTHPNDDDHPDRTEAQQPSPPVHMPAYEAVISEKELEDLVAYYKAVAAYDRPRAEALEGYRIAQRLGCFGCHGPGGLVGSANPQSFKGYIPPWRGGDYNDLVRDEHELRDWIRDGRIERLDSNPVARFFTRSQVIQMPAYRDLLSQDELNAVVSYIQWLQEPQN
jgi:mono/diheme cytochrome c family protein